MGGVKMNSRELKNQLSESSNRESFYIDPKTKEDVIAYHSYKMKCTELGVQELSPEEWKKKGRPFSPVDKCSVPDGFEFGEPEESIPSNEDELLSALEQGKPKLAE
jgi:hypothetical protein